MPDPLDFTFEDFEITLYSELGCILSESQGDFIIFLNNPNSDFDNFRTIF